MTFQDQTPISPSYLLSDVLSMTLAWESNHYRKEPGFSDAHQLFLRLHLIQEELSELTLSVCEGNLQETLDALGDLDVVITGTWLALGLQENRNPNRTIFYDARVQPGLSEFIAILSCIGNVQIHVSKLAFSFAELSIGGAELALSRLDEYMAPIWALVGLVQVREQTSKEILRSNLSKLDPKTNKVIKTSSGRVLKGPGYSPPDLEKILKDYRLAVFNEQIS